MAPSLDRNIAKYDDAKRGLAKLMARENITVQFLDGVPTASFDTVSRVLTIPNWPLADVNQLDTQIGHEIGHALFTDHSYMEYLAKRRKVASTSGLFSYVNCIEDTRIERKMREAYPGMKAVFYEGRKAFAANGPIFQVAGPKHILIDGHKKAVASMALIDRINLFYKIGAFIDIPFAPSEQKWIAKIDACYSTENACEIAQELYDLAKETDKQEEPQSGQGQKGPKQKGPKQKGPKAETEPGESESGADGGDDDDEKNSDGSGDDEAEGGESDDDGDGEKTSTGGDADGDDDDGDNENAGTSGGDAESEDGDDAESKSEKHQATNQQASIDKAAPDPVAETDAAMNRAMQKLVEQNQNSPAASIRHLLLKPMDHAEAMSRTVPASEFVKRCESSLRNYTDWPQKLARLENEWNDRYLATARHMSQEFLRKKTARQMAKARVSKTGKLDMSQLHRYKHAEDLFLRVMTVPEGQSHGIVMIIDGSSSMDSVFGHVMDQMMLFAHFAYRCHIPFESYMFTDRSMGGDKTINPVSYGPGAICMGRVGRLVGLVNTATERGGFRQQMQMSLILRSHFAGSPEQMNLGSFPYSDLGGTPLYAGMMLMEHHMGRMKATLKLDKMIGVVISDGGDTNGLQFQGATVGKNGIVATSMENIGNTAIVVRDTVTKLNHSFLVKSGNRYTAPNNALLTLLFDVMKTRHVSQNIFLFLVENTNYSSYAEPGMVRAGESVKVDVNRDNVIRETKQWVVPNGAADCSIIVVADSLELQKPEDFKTVNVSARNVGAAFVEHQKKAAANRPFVNAMMPYIA